MYVPTLDASARCVDITSVPGFDDRWNHDAVTGQAASAPFYSSHTLRWDVPPKCVALQNPVLSHLSVCPT